MFLSLGVGCCSVSVQGSQHKLLCMPETQSTQSMYKRMFLIKLGILIYRGLWISVLLLQACLVSGLQSAERL